MPAGPGRRWARRGGGSRREIGPGVWELSVLAGRHDDGRQRRAYQRFRGSDLEAAKALAEFVVEVGDGASLPAAPDRNWSVAELVEAYLVHLEENKGRKHSTLTRYRGVAARWVGPAVSSRLARRATPEDFDKLFWGHTQGWPEPEQSLLLQAGFDAVEVVESHRVHEHAASAIVRGIKRLG